MINEHISGEIQHFDSITERWTTYANGILSDVNVFSAVTKNKCCEDSKFSIGGAFSGSLDIVFRLPGFSRYHLLNSRIIIRSWYGNDPSAAKCRGVFWVVQVTKNKDIFTVRGLDAMGWTDVLSPEVGDNVPYFTERITVDGTIGAVLGEWFRRFFEPMNDILETRTGIPDMLQFQEYSASDNCGIQYANRYECQQMWTESSTLVYCGLERGDDTYKTEKPRDVLRWIAEGIGGFITVDGNGVFQMRQFCQPSLGIAEIRDAETEKDSLEIADYYIYPKTLYFKYKHTNQEDEVVTDSFRMTDPYDEETFSGFEMRVELNAILDGVFLTDGFYSLALGLFYAFARYEDVDRINGQNVLVPSVNDQHIGLYKAYPVPFRCKVHKPCFYELGQTVVFPDHPNTYNNYRYGYTANVPYIRSVITSIEWTYRGGTSLACGGGEPLSMMHLALDAKADAVRREMRSRTVYSSGSGGGSVTPEDITELRRAIAAIQAQIGNLKFKRLGKEAYDELDPKDAETIYFVI